MERFKKNAFLKCISLIVIFSFLVLDISWAYPPGSPKTHTLAVQPMFQHQMMNAAGERYQGSLFSQIELRAAIHYIAKFLYGNKESGTKQLPIGQLEAVLNQELGSDALKGITLKEITPKDGLPADYGTISEDAILLIPYEKNGVEYVIQIARRDKVSPEVLIGYKWVLSDKYVAKILSKDGKELEPGIIQPDTGQETKDERRETRDEERGTKDEGQATTDAERNAQRTTHNAQLDISQPVTETAEKTIKTKDKKETFSLRAIIKNITDSTKLHSIDFFSIGIGTVTIGSVLGWIKGLAIAHPWIAGVVGLAIGMGIVFAISRIFSPINWFFIKYRLGINEYEAEIEIVRRVKAFDPAIIGKYSTREWIDSYETEGAPIYVHHHSGKVYYDTEIVPGQRVTFYNIPAIVSAYKEAKKWQKSEKKSDLNIKKEKNKSKPIKTKKDIFSMKQDELIGEDLKDIYRHTLRVERIAVRIAEELKLSEEDINLLQYSIWVHDLGQGSNLRHMKELDAINQGMQELPDEDRTQPAKEHLIKWFKEKSFKYNVPDVEAWKTQEQVQQTGDYYPLWRLYVRYAGLGGEEAIKSKGLNEESVEAVCRTLFSHGLSSLRILDDMDIGYPDELALLVKYHHNYDQLDAVLDDRVKSKKMTKEKADSLRMLESIIIVSDVFEQGNNYERLVKHKGKSRVETFGETINGWMKKRFEDMENISEKRPVKALIELICSRDERLLKIVAEAREDKKLMPEDDMFIGTQPKSAETKKTEQQTSQPPLISRYEDVYMDAERATEICKTFNAHNIICGFSLNASKDPNDPENKAFREGLEMFQNIFKISSEKAAYSFEDQARDESEIGRIQNETLFAADKRTLHLRKFEWNERGYDMNLVTKDTARIIGNKGSVLYRTVKELNPENVSLHLNASIEDVEWGRPGGTPYHQSKKGAVVLNRKTVLDRSIKNIKTLQENLKAIGYDKPVLVETLDYQNTGAYEYVTDTDFIKEVLEATGAHLLIDVAHLYVAAKNKGYKDYLDYVREIVNEDTIHLVDEVHITVPAPNTETSDLVKESKYIDYHLPFYVDTPESREMGNILNYILDLREKADISEPIIVNFETDVEQSLQHVNALTKLLRNRPVPAKKEKVHELFEIVESTINNRRAEFVERMNSVANILGFSVLKRTGANATTVEIVKYAKEMLDLFDRLEIAGDIREKNEAAEGGMRYIRDNLKQLEADSVITGIILLARKAKKEGQNLIIGFETGWIPGYTKGNLQYNAINPLISEIESIGKTLKELGLDNVTVIHDPRESLADKVLDEAERTGTGLSNVIVLGAEDVINSAAFDALRSTEKERRAFLAGIDPSELKEAYNKHKEAFNRQLNIEILQMFYLTMELAAGKKAPDLSIITEYNEALRMVIFLPKAEPVEYNELKDRYNGLRKALIAA